MKVDFRRSDKTAYEHTYYIKKFLDELAASIDQATVEDIRKYLESLNNASSAKYKNILMALKAFFRDFLKAPETVSSFKFPHQVFKPKQILNKEQFQQFYKHLETTKEKTLFLLCATTGLRRDEILSLRLEDIDFSKCMITPDNHRGETKKSWVSFYSEEAEQALNEYLKNKEEIKKQQTLPDAETRSDRIMQTCKRGDRHRHYSTEVASMVLF